MMRLRLQVRPWEFLAEISISIVILYVLALQLLFQSGNILLIFTVISLFATVMSLRSVDLGGWYAVFIVLTSIVSILATNNTTICMTYIVLIIKAFVFYLAIINCMRLKNGFLVICNSTIVAGLILSYLLVFRGVLVGNSLRVTAAESINENIVAASITAGIIFSLFDITVVRRRMKLYFDIASIVFMCFAVLLTGTRKAFIAIIIVLALYVIVVYMPQKTESSKLQIRKMLVSIIACIAVLYFVKYGIDQSNMGERFRNSGYQGDRMRVYYYTQAYRIFCGHPLFGTGWGGFAAQVGMYSHSTYGDLIANTGIFGIILFLIQYSIMFVKGFKKTRALDKGCKEQLLAKYALVSLFIIVVLGVGTVIFYEMNLTLCVGVAYSIIFRKTLAVEGQGS